MLDFSPSPVRGLNLRAPHGPLQRHALAAGGGPARAAPSSALNRAGLEIAVDFGYSRTNES
jgi:hypothetical protein